MNTILTYVKSILLPVVLGSIVGFITFGSMDYDYLIQPSFAPPAILFPIVWSILYTLMGVSYGILKSNSLADNKVNNIYYLQLFVNLLWSIIFFILKWRLFAFFWILLLIVLVILMIVEFYKRNKISGLLQIPYLLWITFASILNLSLYLLNR